VLKNPDGTPYLQVTASAVVRLDPTNAAAAPATARTGRDIPAGAVNRLRVRDPDTDIAAPHDSVRRRAPLPALPEVVVGAIKAATERVAVLYYCLTPLFSRYMDQSGNDDLWMSRGRYDDGFARRGFRPGAARSASRMGRAVATGARCADLVRHPIIGSWRIAPLAGESTASTRRRSWPPSTTAWRATRAPAAHRVAFWTRS
jgi:hypothetical protein